MKHSFFANNSAKRQKSITNDRCGKQIIDISYIEDVITHMIY